MCKDKSLGEMQLASFIELIHSFQVHIVTYYIFSITSYKLGNFLNN